MTKSELRSKWPAIAGVLLEHGPGWYGVLDEILTSMQNAGFDQQRDKITQIKEKFGTVRVYVSFDSTIKGGLERVERIIKAMNVANKSARICESCGQPSHLVVTNGWIMSRCQEHTPSEAKSLRQHFKP